MITTKKSWTPTELFLSLNQNRYMDHHLMYLSKNPFEISRMKLFNQMVLKRIFLVVLKCKILKILQILRNRLIEWRMSKRSIWVSLIMKRKCTIFSNLVQVETIRIMYLHPQVSKIGLKMMALLRSWTSLDKSELLLQIFTITSSVSPDKAKATLLDQIQQHIHKKLRP